MWRLVRLKPFIDVMIRVEQITRPDSIQVNNIPSITSEHLQLYFENQRLFPGVEVADVKVTEDYGIVKFADRQGIPFE